jgi:preprotein translocase subunit SecF
VEIFKGKTHYDFVGNLPKFSVFSGVLVLATILLVTFKGLNFGIEFAGGSEALAAFTQPTPVDDIRSVTNEVGLDQPEIVRYGFQDEGRYFIRSRTRSLLAPAEIDKVRAAVVAKHGEPKIWDASDETGEQIRVRFETTVTKDELQASAAESGIAGITVGVQSQGANPIYLLQMPSIRQRLAVAFKAKFGDSFREIERMESVGSAVGSQMREQGALSLLYAMLGILLYVAFRFDARFGPGAIVSLLHDVTITVGAFALFGWEFNLQIVAALLAILGYSVNDTVVIYDRIREISNNSTGKTMGQIINQAINECMSRTIITSAVTLVSVLAILIFGGAVTRGFAAAMTIGMISGVYSTIAIAASVTMVIDRYFAKNAAAAPAAKPAGAARP